MKILGALLLVSLVAVLSGCVGPTFGYKQYPAGASVSISNKNPATLLDVDIDEHLVAHSQVAIGGNQPQTNGGLIAAMTLSSMHTTQVRDVEGDLTLLFDDELQADIEAELSTSEGHPPLRFLPPNTVKADIKLRPLADFILQYPQNKDAYLTCLLHAEFTDSQGQRKERTYRYVTASFASLTTPDSGWVANGGAMAKDETARCFKSLAHVFLQDMSNAYGANGPPLEQIPVAIDDSGVRYVVLQHTNGYFIVLGFGAAAAPDPSRYLMLDEKRLTRQVP